MNANHSIQDRLLAAAALLGSGNGGLQTRFANPRNLHPAWSFSYTHLSGSNFQKAQ